MFKLKIRQLPFLVLRIFRLTSCKETKSVQVSGPEKIAEKFFDTYKKEGPREALKILLATNKYINNGDSVGIKLQNFTNDLGDFQGYEKIRERTYGQGITLLPYVVKYSHHPLRFLFKSNH